MGTDSFVPADCTLPSEQQPLRVAEFGELFRYVSDVRRVDATAAELTLPGDQVDRARELIRRESACCSFFEFGVSDGDPATLSIRVPDAYREVLDALVSQAETARA
jgi:hypothetical protein